MSLQYCYKLHSRDTYENYLHTRHDLMGWNDTLTQELIYRFLSRTLEFKILLLYILWGTVSHSLPFMSTGTQKQQRTSTALAQVPHPCLYGLSPCRIFGSALSALTLRCTVECRNRMRGSKVNQILSYNWLLERGSALLPARDCRQESFFGHGGWILPTFSLFCVSWNLGIVSFYNHVKKEVGQT